MKYFKEKEQLVFTGQQRKDRNSAEPYCNPMKECFLEKEYNYCQKQKKISQTIRNQYFQNNELKEYGSIMVLVSIWICLLYLDNP